MHAHIHEHGGSATLLCSLIRSDSLVTSLVWSCDLQWQVHLKLLLDAIQHGPICHWYVPTLCTIHVIHHSQIDHYGWKKYYKNSTTGSDDISQRPELIIDY